MTVSLRSHGWLQSRGVLAGMTDETRSLWMKLLLCGAGCIIKETAMRLSRWHTSGKTATLGLDLRVVF